MPQPSHPGVRIDDFGSAPPSITAAATSITAFVGLAPRGPVDEPVEVTGFGDFEREFGGLWEGSTLGFAVRDFFLNGGTLAIIVRVNRPEDLMGSASEAEGKGIYALDRSGPFNLLVIPPYNLDGSVDLDLVTAANSLCERRRAFHVIDAPPTWLGAEDVAVAFATGFPVTGGTNSANAAVFFPRLRQPNPLKAGQVEAFAASGAVAGVIARTDAQRGVWKAPAGAEATLNGVSELSVHLTDADIAEITPLGVNCLRVLPAGGPVVWGSRTMQGADALASEWKYIPVRRTALFIEESLLRSMQWVVFEPNDEPLWARIRQSVGTFLDDLFRQGAFQGATPRGRRTSSSATSETTTQANIDAGIVNIHVGFAPLKPAEFVVIHLQQIAGQIRQPQGVVMAQFNVTRIGSIPTRTSSSE